MRHIPSTSSSAPQQTLGQPKGSHTKKIITSSAFLKKKELLAHLKEKNMLTEENAQALRWYRHFHYKSKQDINAPRFSRSQIGSLASKFGQTPRYCTQDDLIKEQQDLCQFRTLRRTLGTTHQHLIDFVETLFDYPQNDLEFYQSWPLKDQTEKAMALQHLAHLIDTKRALLPTKTAG